MDLFTPIEKPREPLAARMRPRILDDFYGQQHIIGPGRLLRRAIQADQLSSIIFYGPPGTGKTTLAKIIAHNTNAHFIAMNAVLAGIKDLRSGIQEAQKQRDLYHQRTILFIDEVHRWNKAQQDALLPWVENGTIILIGATTENPYFEVIKPLVSRSRLFQLKSLTKDDLRQIVKRAIDDSQYGYGKLDIKITDKALEHIVDISNGDARSMLNAFELAVETTPTNEEDIICIDMEVAEESIQKRAVLYDKEGDIHYDTISAFIKSLRGSDPDAALYWMARMVYAGEDPKFILRRMIIFASEDIGMADPQAIAVVMACAQAFDYVGMPEGRFHLSQAAIHLATAKKGNSTLGFFDALKAVGQEQEAEVPNHLKDANRDAEGFGHGTGYLYPHSYRDHWVAQQYLPETLQGRVFYNPSDQGYEKQIYQRVLQRREAQIAAILEQNPTPEILTFSGRNITSRKEQWLARTVSGVGEFFSQIRHNIFTENHLQRYHRVLDLNAGTGLLTWEALRRVSEGGVWSLVYDKEHSQLLSQQSKSIPEIERPAVWQGMLDQLTELHSQNHDIRYDAIIGRNPFTCFDKSEAVQILIPTMAKICNITIAQTIPKYTNRIYHLLDSSRLGKRLWKKAQQGEEEIYQNEADNMINWDEEDLYRAWQMECIHNLRIEKREHKTQFYVSQTLLKEWFAIRSADQRQSYGQHLSQYLSEKELGKLKNYLEVHFANKTIDWIITVAYIKGVYKG